MDHTKMNSDRVVARLLATELTADEIAVVSGGGAGLGRTNMKNGVSTDTNYS